MIEIIEKKYCTGCEACLNVCPHAAIMMVRDHEGFDYPSIYSDKCVDCGLCVKVCPVLHYEDIADKRKYIMMFRKPLLQRQTVRNGAGLVLREGFFQLLLIIF